MKKQTEQIVKKQLNYYGFTLEFSKVLSYAFVGMFIITWAIYIITSLIQTGIIPYEILNFILQPTLIVTSFYLSTKAIEKVSLNIANYMAKKLELKQQSSNDYDHENNYSNNYSSDIQTDIQSDVQSDIIESEEGGNK